MADDSRIDDLRRRVRKDPASLAFAQLAEELRRAHRFLEAAAVCRAGLEIHPGYLSARVTLGRCLIDLNRLDDAERELEKVRDVAPENLVAVRALAEIQERRRVSGKQTSDVRLKPDATYEGAMPEVRLKPDATYEGVMPDVRLKPDATYERVMPDVRLKPDATYEGGMPGVRLKPDATYERVMPDVRLKPDATYEGVMTGVRLKPDTTYEAAMPAVRLKRDVTYAGERDATYDGASERPDGATTRTLAALEGLLAAIHVTRAHRSA